jgi:hypothetical protein
MKFVQLGLGMVLVLVLAACGGEDRLRTRAAFDMKCNADSLKLTEVGAASYGVEGCGQRQVYVCKEAAKASACSNWVLNSVNESSPK